MIYIYAECYASLYYSLWQINNGQSIIVITINESIKEFCKLNKIEYIYFKQNNLTLKNPISFLKFQQQIKTLYKGLKLQTIDTLILLDNSFAVNGFYLAKLWCKKHKVEYSGLVEIFDGYDKIRINKGTLHILIIYFILKTFFRLELELIENNKSPVLGVGKQFFQNNRIIIKKIDISFESLKLEVLKNFKFTCEQIDTLLIDVGEHHGIVDDSSVAAVYKYLTQYEEKISFKNHPNFKRDITKYGFKTLNKIYPSEFYFKYVSNAVLSFFSTSLILASKFERIKSISLLELVNWENNEYKIKIKDLIILIKNYTKLMIKNYVLFKK